MTVWVKSTFSFSNGNCVEVTRLDGGTVGVRNSRHPDGPVLKFPVPVFRQTLAAYKAADPADGTTGDVTMTDGVDDVAFTPAEWAAFLAGVRAGEFDSYGQDQP